MINIIIPFYTPRLNYTIKVIFEYIYKVPYQIVRAEDWGNSIDNEEFNVVLNYTGKPVSGGISIPDWGFLTVKPESPPDLRPEWHIPEDLNPEDKQKFPFDIFSAVFYWISDYEKYYFLPKDSRDRYYYNVSANINHPFHLPVVHLYCEKLLIFFPKAVQAEILKNRKPRVSLTWDIDNPWKYRHKSFYKMAGGFLKDLFQIKREEVRERFEALLFKKDVNDTYEEIFRLCPPDITAFFFLIEGEKPEDSAFSSKTPEFRKLIQDISHRGYTVGIHPSYDSYKNKEIIRNAIAQLQDITGAPVTDSRQHFLRFHLPDTFRNLYQYGIRREYSYCFTHSIGFPNGMMTDYPWFDLMAETETDLMICPSLLMDRTIVSYLGEPDAVVLAKVDFMLSAVQKMGGIFRMILHNEVLSESAEWKGRGDLLKKIIIKAKKSVFVD